MVNEYASSSEYGGGPSPGYSGAGGGLPGSDWLASHAAAADLTSVYGHDAGQAWGQWYNNYLAQDAVTQSQMAWNAMSPDQRAAISQNALVQAQSYNTSRNDELAWELQAAGGNLGSRQSLPAAQAAVENAAYQYQQANYLQNQQAQPAGMDQRTMNVLRGVVTGEYGKAAYNATHGGYLDRADLTPVSALGDSRTVQLEQQGYTPLQALQIQAKEATNTRARGYYEGEETKLLETNVALSSAYHNAAQASGLPQAPNPYEYLGDLSAAAMKGIEGKGGYGYVTGNIDYNQLSLQSSRGLQDNWYGAVDKTIGSFDTAINRISEVQLTGNMGPYAELSSWSSKYGTLSLADQQAIGYAAATSPQNTQGWAVHPEYMADVTDPSKVYGFLNNTRILSDTYAPQNFLLSIPSGQAPLLTRTTPEMNLQAVPSDQQYGVWGEHGEMWGNVFNKDQITLLDAAIQSARAFTTPEAPQAAKELPAPYKSISAPGAASPTMNAAVQESTNKGGNWFYDDLTKLGVIGSAVVKTMGLNPVLGITEPLGFAPAGMSGAVEAQKGQQNAITDANRSVPSSNVVKSIDFKDTSTWPMMAGAGSGGNVSDYISSGLNQIANIATKNTPENIIGLANVIYPVIPAYKQYKELNNLIRGVLPQVEVGERAMDVVGSTNIFSSPYYLATKADVYLSESIFGKDSKIYNDATTQSELFKSFAPLSPKGQYQSFYENPLLAITSYVIGGSLGQGFKATDDIINSSRAAAAEKIIGEGQLWRAAEWYSGFVQQNAPKAMTYVYGADVLYRSTNNLTDFNIGNIENRARAISLQEAYPMVAGFKIPYESSEAAKISIIDNMQVASGGLLRTGRSGIDIAEAATSGLFRTNPDGSIRSVLPGQATLNPGEHYYIEWKKPHLSEEASFSMFGVKRAIGSSLPMESVAIEKPNDVVSGGVFRDVGDITSIIEMPKKPQSWQPGDRPIKFELGYTASDAFKAMFSEISPEVNIIPTARVLEVRGEAKAFSVDFWQNRPKPVLDTSENPIMAEKTKSFDETVIRSLASIKSKSAFKLDVGSVSKSKSVAERVPLTVPISGLSIISKNADKVDTAPASIALPGAGTTPASMPSVGASIGALSKPADISTPTPIAKAVDVGIPKSKASSFAGQRAGYIPSIGTPTIPVIFPGVSGGGSGVSANGRGGIKGELFYFGPRVVKRISMPKLPSLPERMIAQPTKRARIKSYLGVGGNSIYVRGRKGRKNKW